MKAELLTLLLSKTLSVAISAQSVETFLDIVSVIAKLLIQRKMKYYMIVKEKMTP